MTDKQIIIDGVDVSECPYAEPAYGSPKCRINGYVHCDGFRNCEYKQLKRKKQRIVELNKTIQAKEQECEELKRQHQADKGLITSTGKMNYQLLQEYDKMKAALTEIKEIAEHCITQDICTFCDNSDKCHIEDEEIPTYDVCKLILQKISECEGNDEKH